MQKRVYIAVRPEMLLCVTYRAFHRAHYQDIPSDRAVGNHHNLTSIPGAKSLPTRPPSVSSPPNTLPSWYNIAFRGKTWPVSRLPSSLKVSTALDQHYVKEETRTETERGTKVRGVMVSAILFFKHFSSALCGSPPCGDAEVIVGSFGPAHRLARRRVPSSWNADRTTHHPVTAHPWS